MNQQIKNSGLKWMLLIAVLTIISAGEMTWIEWITVKQEYVASKTLTYYAHTLIRFGINFCFLGVLYLLSPRVMLYIWVGFQLFFDTAVATYFTMMKKTLSFTVVDSMASVFVKEFLSWDYLRIIRWDIVAIAAVFMIMKILVIRRLKGIGLSIIKRFIGIVILAICFGIAMSQLAFNSRFRLKIPLLEKLFYDYNTSVYLVRTSETTFYYGYLMAWYGDIFVLNQKLFLKKANENKKLVMDKLAGIQPLLDLPDSISVIQVESLEYTVIDKKEEGKEVTPFMDEIKKKSLFFKVIAGATNTSSDAEFAFYTGHPAIAGMVSFFLTDYVYENTTQEIAAKRGYTFRITSGYESEGFRQGPVLDKIGYSEYKFRDKARKYLGMPEENRDLADEFIFKAVELESKETKGKLLNFIVTPSTHYPYHNFPESFPKLFPEPKSIEQEYYSAMHYTDQCIRDYVSTLPEGAMVIIYGDHEPKRHVMKEEFFKGTTSDFVPFIIYQKGKDLSKSMKVSPELALSGELHFVDLVTFFRNSLLKQPVVKM